MLRAVYRAHPPYTMDTEIRSPSLVPPALLTSLPLPPAIAMTETGDDPIDRLNPSGHDAAEAA